MPQLPYLAEPRLCRLETELTMMGLRGHCYTRSQRLWRGPPHAALVTVFIIFGCLNLQTRASHLAASLQVRRLLLTLCVKTRSTSGCHACVDVCRIASVCIISSTPLHPASACMHVLYALHTHISCLHIAAYAVLYTQCSSLLIFNNRIQRMLEEKPSTLSRPPRLQLATT